MHVMPEIDAQMLRRMCSLGEVDPLPEKLEAAYWELKRCGDRIGLTPDHRALAMLAYQFGFGKPTEKELAPPSVAKLWREKKVGFDTKIIASWRNGKKPGLLKGMKDADHLIVQLDGDSEERVIETNKVALAA